jgi:hypothetical protein
MRFSLNVLLLVLFVSCSVDSSRTAINSDTLSRGSSTPALDAAALSQKDTTVSVGDTVGAVPVPESRPYRRSWVIGREEGESSKSSRFRATGLRYANGRLVLLLDSARNIHIDSIMVENLGRREGFATTCRSGLTRREDDRVVGIMGDTLHEQWIKPRLAWLFDTVSKRITPVASDGVLCMLEIPD